MVVLEIVPEIDFVKGGVLEIQQDVFVVLKTKQIFDFFLLQNPVNHNV